jgi:hypothetical protein
MLIRLYCSSVLFGHKTDLDHEFIENQGATASKGAIAIEAMNAQIEEAL